MFIPDHAHIPGQNPRHAEVLFDAVKSSAKKGMPLDVIKDSAAVAHGIAYLNHGFYWECHEVLEAVWMALVDHPSDRQVVQGVIQIANGFLKLKMAQPKAALRLHNIATTLLEDYLDDGTLNRSGQQSMWLESGLDHAKLTSELKALKQQIMQYNA